MPGLHGSVRGIGPANGVLPIVATVAVQGIPHNISTSPEGVFHSAVRCAVYGCEQQIALWTRLTLLASVIKPENELSIVPWQPVRKYDL
eukprot:1144925-Pelagomonas_calceolata.AAC.1